MWNKMWLFAIAGCLLCQTLTGLASSSSSVVLGGATYVIDKWDTDDGSPLSSVTAIAQTPDGYLWLGTLNGLVRFDGIRFTAFDENNTPGLNSSRILSLFVDSRGSMWLGTENDGLALFKEGRVTGLGIGRGTREKPAVCEDSNGTVWVYTAEGQLWRFPDGSTNGVLANTNISSKYYRGLTVEKGGTIWLGTDRAQFALNPTNDIQVSELPTESKFPLGTLEYFLGSHQGGYWRLSRRSLGAVEVRVQRWRSENLEKDFGFQSPAFATILAACEDRDGNLVVGTKGAGLFWFDAQGKATSLSTNDGLSHNLILSLHMDREGSLWVGTDGGGLHRIKRQVFTMLEGTRGWVVQSVCEDKEGGLWIGSKGQSVGYWRDGVFRRIPFGPGLMDRSIWAIYADRQQRVWAAAREGLYQFQNGGFLKVGEQPIRAIYQDGQDRLWFGTEEGLILWDEQGQKVFTTREGLSANDVRAIAEDKNSLWIGTMGGGLNQLQNGKFTVYRKQEQGLPNDKISSLYVDRDGVLWIGTEGGGLARFSKGAWTRYSTREGLVSNKIGYILEDDVGYLWVGSSAGLMRMQKSSLNDFARGTTNSIMCRVYERPDGLPTRECTLGSQPGGCRTKDGRLWFPTIKGLGSVDPAQLRPNPYAPPVVIESVLLDGQMQATGGRAAGDLKKVLVPASKERIEIQFTSLNLAAPERARFRYMLEGHETAPTEAGNSRFARYSKLPPGHYRFFVTACNEDGIWNEAGSAVELIVKPPYWRTWWFLSGSSLLLLGSIVGGVHYVSTQKLQRQVEKMQQEEALERDRSRIARDLHDQLGASLTQIALLGELAESDKDLPGEVEGHARQISQTARDTTRVLDEIVWAVNPSNDTLEGLINYVCKYAQEYLAVAGLHYRLDVPSEMPNVAILPEVRHNVFLASKEAVTNVVRHAKATSAWIRVKLESDRFTLEIADDGRGVAGLDPKAPRTRNGLKNMAKRMEDIGGEFSIGPAPEGGALVRLSAPLKR